MKEWADKLTIKSKGVEESMRIGMHWKIVLLHTASTDMHCENEAVWYTITVT